MTTTESSYYENQALWGDDLFDASDRERFDFVIGNLIPGPRNLLDVGCGNGMFLRRVSETFPEIAVHGADRSVAAVSQVSGSSTVCAISSLPFADQSYDVVTCLEVIEHLQIASFQDALSELARVARLQLLVSVPNSQDLRVGRVECEGCRTQFNPDFHLRSFSPSALEHLFDHLGFRAQRVVPFGMAQEFAFARQLDMLKRHRPNRFPIDVPCPACGSVLPAARMVMDDTASGRSSRSLLKAVWPKVKSTRWLLAAYYRRP